MAMAEKMLAESNQLVALHCKRCGRLVVEVRELLKPEPLIGVASPANDKKTGRSRGSILWSSETWWRSEWQSSGTPIARCPEDGLLDLSAKDFYGYLAKARATGKRSRERLEKASSIRLQ